MVLPLNTNTKRILWLDVTKLFAIFLVLWGHCVQHFLTTDEWSNYIYIYIYSFHMPLFMVISGFFAGNIFKHSFFKAIYNKAWQLLMPVLIWGSLLYLIDTNLMGKDTTSYTDTLFNNGYFWFLKSLFSCFLLFAIGTYSLKNKYIGLIIVLIISQLFSIYLIRYMFPCFVLGYIINMNFQFFIKYILIILTIAAIIFVSMLPNWGEDKMWPSLSVSQIINNPIDSLYLIYYKLVIGISGAVICIGLCYLIFRNKENCRFTDMIGEWGQYTLSIYIFQSIILESMFAYYINIDQTNDWRLNFVLFPIISLIILAICVYLHKAMLKNTMTKFFLQPSWNQFCLIFSPK